MIINIADNIIIIQVISFFLIWSRVIYRSLYVWYNSIYPIGVYLSACYLMYNTWTYDQCKKIDARLF